MMPALLLTTRRWVSTLKFRIVLLAALTGLLSAVGTAAVVVRSANQSIERVVLASARSDRERSASLLGSKVFVLRDALVAVARHMPEPMWADRAAMRRYLLNRPAVNSLFSALYAVAPDGDMLARVEAGALSETLPSVADRDYFKRAITSDQPVLSEVLWGKVLNAPVVVIAVPVLGRDGRHLGLIAGSLALQSAALFDEVRAHVHDDSVTELVVDRAGLILSHEDPSRLLRSAIHEPGLGRVVREWMASGSPIDTVGVATFEEGHVVSHAGIPLTDWIHVRVRTAAYPSAPVAAASASALRAAVGAGLLAALLAGALAYAITQPISRLKRRAEALLENSDSVPGWPEEAGEVGQLAKIFRHVVEQREKQKSVLQALLVQLEAVLDNAEVGIALTRAGHFELVTRQFCQIFRCDKADAIGQSTRMIYPSDAAYQKLIADAGPALTQHGVVDTELELIRNNGVVFWARMRGRAVVPGDVARGTIWTVEDVSAAREQRERLTYTASHDALTGLFNRATFERLLDEATVAAAAGSFCVLFIDLDRFKQVNDTGGHAAGDALLRDVAQVLSNVVRKSDVVARLGGDEFAVLLPGCAPEQARSIAEKLCAAVQGYELVWNDIRFAVGASVGLVVVDHTFQMSADVLRAADSACYAAKRHGRSRVEQYQPSAFQVLAAEQDA